MEPTKSRRRAKTHRSYTFAEVARFYDVHRNTVRHSVKIGLSVVRTGGLVLTLGKSWSGFAYRRELRPRE